jgi:nitrite reductase/ring-hydroxylating ferredoxin subunit
MQMTRRQFVVVTTTTAACAACACGDAADALAADAPAAPAPAGTSFDVGTTADFNLFFVVRNGGKLYAPSAKCTHKGCGVKQKAGTLACPCHDSSFDLMGIPKGGPAKTSLIRYAITKTAEGRIIVDKSKQFDEKQWDDPAAFVKVG